MRAAGHDVERAERELAPALQLVSSALTEPYLAVVEARSRGDLDALRGALRAPSRALTTLLEELERLRAEGRAEAST